MNDLVPIDHSSLDRVTGGTHKHSSSSGIDSLLSTLTSITSAMKDIKSKTSGFGQSEMLLLCMLALQRRQPANVVYVRRWP